MTTTPPPTPLPPGKGQNVLGTVALVSAILSVVLVVIPVIFWVGWFTLPISLVLGVIALFLKGKKWQAITAIVISLLGFLVAAVAYMLFVGDAMANL